jgi:hypothetical protein
MAFTSPTYGFGGLLLKRGIFGNGGQQAGSDFLMNVCYSENQTILCIPGIYNRYVGIGTTNPQRALHIVSPNTGNDSPLFVHEPQLGSGHVTVMTVGGDYANFRCTQVGFTNNGTDTSNVATLGLLGGTSALVVNSVGGVGIGTVNPGAALQIGDATSVYQIPGTYITKLSVTDSGYAANGNKVSIFLGTQGSANNGFFMEYSPTSSASTNYFRFIGYNGGQGFNQQLVSGNVGIGTTNPQTGLHCYNSTNFSLLLDNGTNSSLFQQAAGSGGLYIRTGTGTAGGTNGLYLTSGGTLFGPNADLATSLGGSSNRWTTVYAQKAMIGSGNSISPLQIQCNDGYQGGITLSSAATNATGPLDYMIQRGLIGGDILGAGTNTSNIMLFHTTNEQQSPGGGKTGFVWMSSGTRLGMYFDTTNTRLGIGTTNPTHVLKVYGLSAANDPPLHLTNSYNATSQGRPWLCGPDSTANFIVTAGGTGAYIAWGTTTWTGTSDMRLKNIIEPISNALAKVDILNPVIYSWKSDENNDPHPGLIAQDVLTVQPEAVSIDKDGYYGVRYSELIPLAFAAIKELSAKNTALEARIAALESR